MAHTENDGISLAIYEGNFVEQKDEIIALQSIFEGDIEERICVLSEPDSCGSGQYVIQAKVPFEMNVKECQVDIWIPTGDTPSIDEQGASAADGPPQLGQGISLERTLSGQKWSGSFKVQFLPPLTLDLTFPSDYPSHSPPSFTVSSIWLSGNQLSLLCKHLDRLWEDNRGIPIVFTWVDWLEKETLHFLGIEDSIVLMPAESSDDDVEDKRVVIDCFDLGEAVHTMLQYSNHKAAVRFFQSMQECGLCFEEKLGSQFFRFTPCFHHFCSDCLAVHCNMHVTEGTINLLKCPASKCETVIPPDVLQTVLSPKLYIRWETLSVQKTLDEMNDITYCPRCKSIVISEAELSLHLGFCLSCFYSFCTQCERAWHQGTPCQSEEDVLQEKEKRLQSGDTTALKKFREMKKKMMEEARSEEEIKKKTVRCPRCHMMVEKNGGCNYMTCRCGQAFCWLCGKPCDGYSHFNTTGCSVQGVIIPVPTAHRRQLPDALLMIRAQLEVTPDAKDRLMFCKNCKQENLKRDKNNHLHCWNCKVNLCFFCKSQITGNISKHFLLNGCLQHS